MKMNLFLAQTSKVPSFRNREIVPQKAEKTVTTVANHQGGKYPDIANFW
jgi:hypothetical protein